MKRKTKDGWTEVVDAGGQVVATVDELSLARDLDRRHRNQINLTVSPELAREIGDEAARQGVTRSSLCVALIREGLSKKRKVKAEPLPRGLAAASEETGERVRAAKGKRR